MNCELHDQPILGYSEKDQLRKGLCSICLAQQREDFVFTEEANHKIVQFGRWFLEQFDTLNQNYTLQLKSLIQDINDIKTFINQSIDKLITNIQDWIGEATKQKSSHQTSLQDMKNLNFNEFNRIIKIGRIKKNNLKGLFLIQFNKQKYQIGLDWQTMPKGEIQKIAEILSNPKTEGEIKVEINKYCTKQQDVINKIVNDSIINLQKSEQTNFNKILQLLKKDTQSTDLKQLQKERVEQNNQLKDVINYKKLDQYTIQQNEYCYCLCFNKDKNILAVGCDHNIKIFKFENGKMTEIQLLKGHTSYVNALYIGNNNQIYSCSNDNTIKIWVQQSNQWIMHQSLQGHTNQVWCITMNKEEDQLITGGCDYTIKCWMKTQDQWKCVQTLQHHSYYVLSLSLNESQNQLLSCGNDKQLNIFKCDSNNQWSLTQKIIADDYVNRASFINDNIIVYQLDKGILKVYKYNQTEFKQKQDIQVKGSGGCYYFFPQVYCKQQSILVNKNSKFINIIRIKKDNQFVVEQVIEFQSCNLYGTITNDGQFLVTWDYDSKQIQVRQLQ